MCGLVKRDPQRELTLGAQQGGKKTAVETQHLASHHSAAGEWTQAQITFSWSLIGTQLIVCSHGGKVNISVKQNREARIICDEHKNSKQQTVFYSVKLAVNRSTKSHTMQHTIYAMLLVSAQTSLACGRNVGGFGMWLSSCIQLASSDKRTLQCLVGLTVAAETAESAWVKKTGKSGSHCGDVLLLQGWETGIAQLSSVSRTCLIKTGSFGLTCEVKG